MAAIASLLHHHQQLLRSASLVAGSTSNPAAAVAAASAVTFDTSSSCSSSSCSSRADMCSPPDTISTGSSCSPLMMPRPLALLHGHVTPASEDSDSDEVLSVGSETPPPPSCSPLTSPPSSAGHQDNVRDGAETSRAGLKFSIDNILKPDFGRGGGAISPNSACDNSANTIVLNNNIRHHHKPKSNKNLLSNKDLNGVSVRTVTTDVAASATVQPINLSAKDAGSSPGTTATATGTTSGAASTTTSGGTSSQPLLWPAWVYCTRYSDRPSSGRSPRSRKIKRKEKRPEEKRPRTAFTSEQLARLKHEFQENRYLTERRRQQLASELKLNESQIKIWFQNKRAKIKKASGQKNPLALQLMAQGLYNHSTIPSGADSGDEDCQGPLSPASSSAHE